MTCAEAGCDRQVVARGMCGKHYAGWQRAGKPDNRELLARARTICDVADCDKAVYAKQHCSRHYRQLLRSCHLREEAAPHVCSVATCERKAVTRGWCHGHYIRWNRGGDVRADEPLTRDVIDICVVDDCGRGATSTRYCRTHYNRWKLYGDPLAGGPIRVVTGDGSIQHGYWWTGVRPDQRHLVPDGRKRELEHRLVMAEVLGRPLLAEESVHHRNRQRLDNRKDNLELWSSAQPKGQRVEDKLAFARALIELYEPEVAEALGWDLDPDGGAPWNYQWPIALGDRPLTTQNCRCSPKGI